MKTFNYSDCFYQVRNGLRQMIANNFMCANLFIEHGVMDFDLISSYADDLTAFNEVSGLPFFVPFRKFADNVA